MIPPVPDVPSPNSTVLPPPAIDPNIVFYKTRLCHTFSTRGSCPYGHLCRFAHGPADLREPVPNWQDIAGTHKTKLCRNYAAGACPYGQRCLYSHPHPRWGGSAARPTVPAAPAGGNASRFDSPINARCDSAHGSAVLKQTTPASVAEAVKDSVEAATASANSSIHVGTGTPPDSRPTQQCFPKLRGIKKLNRIYADWLD
ncbi:hypothetical protein OPV22_027002 [Ensete ventricosum]|uniref:C3H1-type domain-containing protein n=1 Tax=Ensete ventricosum TaxID=4639 RepID=A0AAV8Q6K6_ENSVE|nr:hypothetical protein OPV22_027002 [Ensete ventricosum]